MKEYLELVKRCKEQNIDIDNCHLYINHRTLDGNLCREGTLSQDKQWICIPEQRFDESFDEFYFEPICYQIKDSFTTYLHGDSLWYLVECLILYKRPVEVVKS